MGHEESGWPESVRFSAATTVEQVLKADPRCGSVFAAHGIDTCCGGGATLAEAAARSGMTLDALLGALGSGVPRHAPGGAPASPAAGAATDAPSFAPFFIWSLILALSFGATLGALALAAIALPSANFLAGVPLAAAKAAHAYAQVFGFATLFVMGVAYHTMPRYKSTVLAAPGLAAKTLWLQGGGVFVVAVGVLVGPPLGVLMWLAGTLSMFGAAVAFNSIVHRTLGATPPLPEGFEPYLRAGCGWLLVACGLSVASVATAAGVGIGVQPAVWAAALWGFAGCWSFGMSLRVLPVFLGLPRPRERRGLFASYQGAVLLWVASALVETWTPLPVLRVGAGVALVLTVVTFVFRLGIFGPREAHGGAGVRDDTPFIPTAYVWLLAAVIFEPGWSAGAAVLRTAAAPPVLDFGRHAFTLGFLTQMIVGVATRIVPVITRTPLWSATCTRATYSMLNAAVAVRAVQAVVAMGSVEAIEPYVSLSGPLGVAAFGAFATNVLMTMRLRRAAAVAATVEPEGAVQLPPAAAAEMTPATVLHSPVRAHIALAMPVQPAPIIVRDPFLEFLGLVGPGEPVAVTFEELVKAAGHLCPTVAGAYLILKHGLAALYGEEPAVRGQVRVTAYGRPQDFGYGPMAQLVNLVVGAAPETGFGGLGPGRFARRNLFVFKSDEVRRHEFDLERLDTGRAVHVVYDPGCVPAPPDLQSAIGPALAESATREEVDRFRRVWLGRVHDILSAGNRTVRLTEIQHP